MAARSCSRSFRTVSRVAALLSLVAATFACSSAPSEGEGSTSEALVCRRGQTKYCEPGELGKMVCVCEGDTTDPPDASASDASTPDSSSQSCPVGQQLCGCTPCPSYCTANRAYCLDLVNGYCAPSSHCAQH